MGVSAQRTPQIGGVGFAICRYTVILKEKGKVPDLIVEVSLRMRMNSGGQDALRGVTSPRGRRGITALAGAAALILMPSMIGASAPAVAQERGEVSAAGRCGSPEIKISYPGRHPKIYFKSPSGCSRGRHVLGLGAAVWCDGRRVVRVQAGSVVGKTPIKTPTKKLPTKANCKRLQATANIRYVQADFDDDWAWKWGNFPA